ncbi:hypothetical protein CONLIGDRAFT_313644 [Coniochaeta ligniaria NRRL 30616]|uniref:Uncharacterized protein n=1 Tax=Coniochaeta ligniaria NRRL 30616 TaxID=1408157 RepID=A0A1J7JN90_9PEZI|nr:hypothetical protein CONLIGDRAFT_313644 [Coniochaeta ligniaria NRRL 30616]
MRPTTTLIQLCIFAPVALCSPIPFVLVGDIEAVSGAAHPPAPVVASRPKHALPKVIVFGFEEEDGQETPIDNRPITPSTTAQPSVVLASPRPIATEYLLSLAHHPWMRRKGGGPKLSKLPAEVVAAIESSSTTQAEMGKRVKEMEVPVSAGRIGMPCYYASLGRSRNDVLAISLIFIFVAVVVVVETFSR